VPDKTQGMVSRPLRAEAPQIKLRIFGVRNGMSQRSVTSEFEVRTSVAVRSAMVLISSSFVSGIFQEFGVRDAALTVLAVVIATLGGVLIALLRDRGSSGASGRFVFASVLTCVILAVCTMGVVVGLRHQSEARDDQQSDLVAAAEAREATVASKNAHRLVKRLCDRRGSEVLDAALSTGDLYEDEINDEARKIVRTCKPSSTPKRG
jgi:hypothetical protein